MTAVAVDLYRGTRLEEREQASDQPMNSNPGMDRRVRR